MGRGPRKRAREAAAAVAVAAAVQEQAGGGEKGKESASTVAATAHKAKPDAQRRKKAKVSMRQEDEEGEEGVLTRPEAGRRLAAWTDNEARLQRWLDSRGGGLEEKILEAGGKILRLRDFLPLEIADSALAILEGLPEKAWELSEQGGEADAASHRFWSADVVDVPELSPLRTVFWKMLKELRGEPTLPIFSCGRYASSDFIGRHDDRAHVPFFNDDNIYSRTVAAIWYLTKEWSEQDGGCLLDLEGDSNRADSKLVPLYNSLVVFEVPHWHAVSAVTVKRNRYSIFGWWHQKGKRYELPGALSLGASKLRKVKKKSSKKKAAATNS